MLDAVNDEDLVITKVLVYGNKRVGKTSLLNNFVKKKFTEQYSPTDIENYVVQFEKKHAVFQFDLFEFGGNSKREDRDQLVDGCHIILLCFDLCNNESLKSIQNKWMQEINSYKKFSATEKILIGMKLDIRKNKKLRKEISNSGKFLVQTKAGEKVRKKIKARKYFEMSAKDTKGKVLNKLQDELIKIMIEEKKPIKKKPKNNFGLNSFNESSIDENMRDFMNNFDQEY